MNTNQNPDQNPDQNPATPPGASDLIYAGQPWIRAALAEQEEHIKRLGPCMGVTGKGHAFRTFGKPNTDGTIPRPATFQACIVCGVTQSAEDYQRKIG